MQDLCGWRVNMFEAGNEETGHIGTGLLAGIGLYLVQAFLMLRFINMEGGKFDRFLLAAFFVLPPFSQLLYIVPIAIKFKKRRQERTANGLLGGAIFMGLVHLSWLGPMWWYMR